MTKCHFGKTQRPTRKTCFRRQAIVGFALLPISSSLWFTEARVLLSLGDSFQYPCLASPRVSLHSHEPSRVPVHPYSLSWKSPQQWVGVVPTELVHVGWTEEPIRGKIINDRVRIPMHNLVDPTRDSLQAGNGQQTVVAANSQIVSVFTAM